MTNEHKHAELLRLAADNEDQLFKCKENVINYELLKQYLFYSEIEKASNAYLNASKIYFGEFARI